MFRISFIRIWPALLGIVSSTTFAAVTVTFVGAESYSDARQRFGPEETVDEIKRHLESLGARYLSPSQNLAIEIRDIDLAGRNRLFFRGAIDEIRVMNGRADWPSMKLRYTLEADGKTSPSVEETIADMDYLHGPKLGDSRERLYYEKRMLDNWLRQRFVEGRKPAP